MPHLSEKEKEAQRVTWFAYSHPAACCLSGDSRAGLQIPRPDRNTGEEAQFGYSWNVATDLDWAHFYKNKEDETH